MAEPQDDASRSFLWGICPYISKTEVHCDKGSSFPLAEIPDDRIVFSSEFLVKNTACVMPCRPKNDGRFGWKVFVYLELHPAVPASTGITSSRANSAAYAMAACMSCRERDG